jgi:ammonium transporter, Amt family
MKLSFKSIMPFLVLVVLALAAMFIKPEADYVPGASETQYSAADIAWVLVSTALVFLMTPGLAFFYGGMVHRKNVISTMIKSVVAAVLV